MYLVFTRVPGESYVRNSGLCYLCYAFVLTLLSIFFFFFNDKSETRMIADVLKQDSNTQNVQSTGHEKNIAEPKTDKWLSSPSHFPSFFTV